jgi:hypothetical protein
LKAIKIAEVLNLNDLRISHRELKVHDYDEFTFHCPS